MIELWRAGPDRDRGLQRRSCPTRIAPLKQERLSKKCLRPLAIGCPEFFCPIAQPSCGFLRLSSSTLEDRLREGSRAGAILKGLPSEKRGVLPLIMVAEAQL